MRRRPRFSVADFARIRSALEGKGYNRDFISGDDINELWARGCSVDDVIEYALRLASRMPEVARGEQQGP